MRLVVDARMMGAGNTRGIGRYIKEITDHIRPKLKQNDELVLLESSIPWYGLAEQLRFPSIIRAAKPDLLWVPHWNVPLLYRGPLAITIHDLLLRHQPTSAKASTRGPIISWLKRFGHRIVLSNAIHRASVILVPTQAVADDINKYYPSAQKKVVVTGEGLSELPQPSASKISGDYLLYVGSAYPHKRLDLLIDAWPTISKNHPTLSLVIPGKDDVFLSRIKSQVQNNRVGNVLFVGSKEDQELSSLYSNASAFVFPTSFEGFGLPPIEALSAGTPVIASDIPVLREVLPSKGVFFFKSGDKDGMITAIESCLADLPKAKSEARQGGQEVRRRHRWEDAAGKTLAALRSIAHHH
jgi:glycosyltransferase involved in cell wall biosynthesis